MYSKLYAIAMIKARVLLSRSKRKKIDSTIGLYSTAFVDNTAPPQWVKIISEKSRFYFHSVEFPPVTLVKSRVVI